MTLREVAIYSSQVDYIMSLASCQVGAFPTFCHPYLWNFFFFRMELIDKDVRVKVVPRVASASAVAASQRGRVELRELIAACE